MAKYAFLFPGQGAQEKGMMRDVCESFPEARKVLDSISSITGKDVAKLMWETEAAELSRSDNSQLVVMSSSLIVSEVLKAKGIVPSAVMGFSLGEFPALCLSGVLSFEDTVRLVNARGEIFQKVCESIATENAGNAPGMSAIIGLQSEKIKEICDSLKDVYVANLNSEKQTVLSGTADGLTLAEDACKASGARRALRLSVAGPFHCPLMQKAADDFEKFIADIKFENPKIDLYSNVTGSKVLSGEEAKKNAVIHITNSVKWTSEEKLLGESMASDSSNEWKLIEPGVGRVLTGLWKDSTFGDKFVCSPANSTESINAI